MDIGKVDRMPAVKSVMTPFPHSIEAGASLASARDRMIELGIRHLPVMDGDTLTGIVTEREARLALANPVARDAAEPRLEDVVSHDPYAVDLHTPLDVVLAEMARRHAGSALVLKGGKLVGIFTASDACKRLGELLRARFPSGDDAA